jgi:DNA polymerase-1
MKHLALTENIMPSYRYVILVNNIRETEIRREYIDRFGLPEDEVMILDLHNTPGKKKTPAAEMKEYIETELQPVLDDLGAEYVLVCNAEYFKTYTKAPKADALVGYVISSAFGPQNVVYVPNYEQIFYDPDKVKAKIESSMVGLANHVNGQYTPPGDGIIKYADYPQHPRAIAKWLNKLLKMDTDLTCDIEGFGLKHFNSGIGTITFCWNQEEGIAFPVDYNTTPKHARIVRKLLKRFFRLFKRKMIYHNIAFDAYVLIYQLFMDNLLDQKGLLNGLKIMLRNWDDTKLIAYLATNSCSGNKLSLKEQAQEFAGNWAVEEIKDIRKIALPVLLQYNLVDGLSTWFTYNKQYPVMVTDNQLDIYENIFKPAIVDIIQMQLTGMPVDMKEVQRIKPILQKDSDDALARMLSLPVIMQFEYTRLEAYTAKKNAEWKTKRMTVSEMQAHALIHEPTKEIITFNPNSGPQLQELLFETIGLPVLSYTKSKQPSTDADSLKALKNHTTDAKVLDFLDALLAYKAVDTILKTFIPALEGAQEGPDGWHYLFGNFNLGGTVSGRLSSSGPNLQNLPATGTIYAKLIKGCFKAPPGWFFCGIDFNSLEDRISALTTKDPNKLKVYTDGYDGHCLRAFAYFGEQMTGVIDGNVKSINSIKKLYDDLRQKSKAPTFALTYQGTYRTLMTNCGFSLELALDVEKKYHVLYKVSDDWVADKLDKAMQSGFVEAAFGLKVRTPLLKQVIRGTRKTPHEAEAEGRTAGNALGQSWCLLNTRAGTEFMGKVRESEFALDIKPCAQIHDAQYFLVRDDIDAVMYANEHVVKACEWQDHPDIWHDEVKLGGGFSIFWPSWVDEMSIPNNATPEQIYEALSDHMDELEKV